MDPPSDGRIAMTRIRWEIGDRLSALHAARCWAAGTPGIDSQLAAKLADPLSQLTKRLAAAEIDLEIFWSRLIATAASGSSDSEACQAALLAAGLGELGIDGTSSAILTHLAETRLAFQERYPKSSQQLSLRARPIREQWEAYGAGLLRRMATQTHESFIPKSVVCVLLSPYRGGDGDCDPGSATLWMEAVLTNPVPMVPEVLRLAWLVMRVGAGAQILQPLATEGTQETDDCKRAALVLALALLPVVLEASSYLELSLSPSGNAALISAAAQAWCGPLEPAEIDTILKWWGQSEDLKPAFPVALKALDRMLPGKPSLQLGMQH